MSYAWFRFYDEVVDDPKVQRLPERLFKAWINLMCIANKHSHSEGTLPPIADVAYRLHITIPRAEALLAELIKADLFESHDGLVRSHNWTGRQFQSDVSTERVKRFRNAQRNVSETVTCNESRNAPESDTESESDTDTESEQKPTKSPAPSAPELGFLEFWNLYPRKVGKASAMKAWRKVAPQNGMREIIFAAIQKQKQWPQWLRDSGQYIPHPATWLNRGQWDDEEYQNEDRSQAIHDLLK